MMSKVCAYKWFFISIILFLLLSPGRYALADGCFVKSRVYEKAPTIPAQQAVLMWASGRETLIIESALDGQGEEFGWIVPLPAVPDRVEASSNSIFRVLDLSLQPEIIHYRGSLFWAVGVLTAFVLFWSVVIVSGAMSPGWKRTLAFSLTLLVAFMLAAPNLLGLRKGVSENDSGVTIHRQGMVGDYEIAVLSAKDDSTLKGWLESNGFSPPARGGEKIIRDYIADGWCFVATRLRREGKGAVRPHPLLFEFNSKKPVYPMRLTAVAAERLPLTIYVVGQEGAEQELLETRFSDHFVFLEHVPVIYRGGTARGYRSVNFDARLGDNGLINLLPGKCWITKLSGELSREDMSTDMVFTWAGKTPRQKILYSHKGAWHMSGVAGCLVLSVLLVVLVVAHRGRLGDPERRLWGMKRVILPALLIALCVAGIYRATRDVVEIKVNRKIPAFKAFDILHTMQQEGSPLVESPDMESGKLAEACMRFLREESCKNPYTEGEINIGTGPGDIEVFRMPKGNPVFVIYDKSGFPFFATRDDLGMLD